MNAWLDANAAGLAMLFWASVGGLGFVLVAAAIEWVLSAPMRRRAARRRMIQRYSRLEWDGQ